MDEGARAPGGDLDALQGRRAVPAVTPGLLEALGQAGQRLHLLQVGDDDAVATRGALPDRFERRAVAGGAAPRHGGVDAPRLDVGDDAEDGGAVLAQGQRDGVVAVGLDVVHGAVDGVEHPHEAGEGADRVPLLAEQGVSRGLPQRVGDMGLDGPVDGGHQVVAARLGLHVQVGCGAAGDVGGLPHDLQGGLQQGVELVVRQARSAHAGVSSALPVLSAPSALSTICSLKARSPRSIRSSRTATAIRQARPAQAEAMRTVKVEPQP